MGTLVTTHRTNRDTAPPAIDRGPVTGPRLVAPEWDSDQLLAGAHEVLIRHGGEVYRLRRTRQGKLILTK